MRKWLMLFTLGALALALALPALADEGKRFRGSDCGPFQVVEVVSTDPLVVRTGDVATGRANRGIGRYTLVAQELVNLETLAVTDGQFTITSRKGSISGTYSGSAAATEDPAVITYHVEGPITGGTGRFAGASGHIVFDGIARFTAADRGNLCDKVSGVLVLPDDEDDD